MNCPVCGEKMKEIEKCGVELDLCPGCKGVWLDRGELEKLMEYVAAAGAGAATTAPVPPPLPEAGRGLGAPRPECREPYRHDDHDDDHDDDRHEHDRRERNDGGERYRGDGGPHGPYPRKKSWLSDILDVFGD